MKQAVLFISLLLATGYVVGDSNAAQNSVQSIPQRLAQNLEQQGHQFLDHGNPQQAYRTWEQALKIYQKNKIETAIPPLLINQSIALQHMGYPIKACLKLVTVLQKDDHICQSRPLKAKPERITRSSTITFKLSQTNRIVAQINLGKVLRQLGHLKQATLLLQQAQQLSDVFNAYKYSDMAALELADLQQIQFDQARDRAQLTTSVTAQRELINQAIDAAQNALQSYKILFSSDIASPQAQLYWLKLYEKLNDTATEFPEVASLIQQNRAFYQDTLVTLLNQQPKNSLSDLYGQLSLAEHLLYFSNSGLHHIDIDPLPRALVITQNAIRESESFNDATVTTEAYQTLGEIYLAVGQAQAAQAAFQRASRTAQDHDNWEGLYQAQSQLARIQSQSNPDKAIRAYEIAIASLSNIRQDLLPVSTDIQFSFRDEVEPIYHDYMQLLLNQPRIDYQRVIHLNENLRVAELINFLRCGQLDLVSLNQVKQHQELKPATLIHILNIGNDIHVIAQTQEGYHHHQANSRIVQRTLARLNLNLRSDNFAFSNERQLQDLSQTLYYQLLQPLSSHLKPNSTLAFSLDSTFQGFPMALLYDGTRYLVENHPISTNFGSKIPALPQDTAPLKVLIAGLSTVGPSFAQVSETSLDPLPAINQETQTIAKLSKTSKLLLNETFTLKKLQQSLEFQRFPYLHIATHGSFSSDPEETYLLAWDQKIELNDLETLLQTPTSNNSPLDLLVLSACETAKGDRRAALGLAGVATQSGAQSTLASLWKVDDRSSSQLMEHFYSGLKSGLSKAEALRQAQLQLLKSDTNRSPYYWAPFILLGHWR